jgi:superfamily II DNA or RNA helicase
MGFRDLTALQRRYAGQAGQLVNEFYIPVLSQATRYDRQAGYFDSATLVQLASGLAAFIRRVRDLPHTDRPPMRLITGATWSPEDIAAYQRGVEALHTSLERSLVRHFAPSEAECIRLGLPPGWRPEEDQIARQRFGTLAWMVWAGLLEVRIALPLDDAGRPYHPGRYGALYHPKAGILYNGEGNIIAFQGSVNETSAAWTRNREKFDVKRSWYSEQDAEDIRCEIDEFEAIWQGRDPGLLVLSLPRAVQEHLEAFRPTDGPPERDPMEIDLAISPRSLRDRIAAQWWLDAPQRPGGARLVLHPLWADGKPLQPFPHQTQVWQRAVAAFPQSYLFCDEVGLGKTIEAGLGLRTLILRGALNRVLLIAPRSLVRQWMEELREKFALTAWFFDGYCLRDVDGHVRWTDHPWEENGIIIVSRHLIARADRRAGLLAVQRPWDAVLVDEAHAARRRVFGDRGPNQLLGLLQTLRARSLFRCLWLLTATPMQLDPHEVHDLLLLCGLNDHAWGRWSDLAAFQGFFEGLRRFPQERQVRADVLAMTRLAVARGAPELDATQIPPHWTQLQWQGFVAKVKSSGPGLALDLQRRIILSQAESLTPYLTRQTPLAVFMFRYTRATLRAYQERGMIQGGLARREPEDIPVAFQTDSERALYNRIDDLCRRFYRLADLPAAERSGVGFLMAVFRKRLASCFAAFQRSLERRRDLIAAIQHGLSEVDAQREFRRDVAEEDEDEDSDTDIFTLLDQEHQRLVRLYQDPRRREELEAERLYLQDYITALDQVVVDSKFDAFQRRLAAVVAEGHRVIVFTQYLDTLDFIRNQLVARYGDRMACYSGRGGEIWDASMNTWRVVDKAEIKARSQRQHPHAMQILLGTDAASEGLNLQQFSALINYDLPWNPMRVEQRIGRIDRIGQEAPTVKIVNLYVQGTIEEDAYYTLRHRIGAFEEVIGPLQPILAEMPRIFRRLARGELELAEARRLLDAAARAQPHVAIASLEACVREEPEAVSLERHEPLSVTQSQLAAWCLAHPAPGMRIIGVPEPGTNAIVQDGIQGCLAITWAYAPPHLGIDPTEEVLATFNGALADRHPPTAPGAGENGVEIEGKAGVRLLTWGDPYLTAWLKAVRGAPLIEADYHMAGLEPDTNPYS